MVAVQGQVIRNGCIALGLENSADHAVTEQKVGGHPPFWIMPGRRMTRQPCGGNGDGGRHVNPLTAKGQ